MYKIAFDLMGNDYGDQPALQAVREFIQKNTNFTVLLVGNKTSILEFFANQLPANLEIIDNSTVASDTKNLRQALKENTSMNTALQLLANNEVDAVLSPGDSGLLLSAATFIVKRLPGISRAAFMPIMPSIKKGKKTIFLDVGANLEVKDTYFVEWAHLAKIFAKTMLKVNEPKIALINVGTEEYKGLEVTRSAHGLLKNEKNLNYQGFVEPRDMLTTENDVVLADGYAGNLVLKSFEGAILSFGKLLKTAIKAKFWRKIGYLFLKGAFRDTAETLDYRNVGAAWVLGLNGLVIKTHGSSDVKSYLGALNQVKLALETNTFTKIKEELDHNEQQN
ncbi:phosphate acyltransferase PlsX [Mycoplasmopsis columbinasalis]|uniref:Phosphate acyltransferase n=1 Tax=Mycoplasmopsis columbinasalis TaxID=114880 RepID=A0A449BAK8_9BACT|nr:phosphate acyltransferase PlsX [Mycoplasmopsis columbinasalis]VEU78067.1 fatty acid/phospholipid synthesis protein PlsX [Mycoplasmopsis columbinasalis]